MSRTLLSWTRRPHSVLPWWALLVLACASARAFRLNPGEEPARFRIVCRDSIRQCDRSAKEHCDGEYTVENREMTRPEQEEVDDSDLSSTGPSEGFVGWRSEVVVKCGRELPELRLVRPKEAPGNHAATAAATVAAAPMVGAAATVATAAATVATAAPTGGPPSPAKAPNHWCVPGATQACLGPGACSGAQVCLRDGSGYGACDCGTTPLVSPSSATRAAPLPRTTSGGTTGASTPATER